MSDDLDGILEDAEDRRDDSVIAVVAEIRRLRLVESTLVAEIAALRAERDHFRQLAADHYEAMLISDARYDVRAGRLAQAEAEMRRLRDGIRTTCEWWDRERPDGSAFEVTSDFRDLLDGKEA